MLRVSVIIPTFNRCKILASTLPTVFGQDFPKEDYEVIVVVDGSTDGTLEMLRSLKPECGFQVLEQSNQGQTAAKNLGAASARGDLLLFLDDDILCEPSLLKEHVSAQKEGKPLLVFGPVFVAHESRRSLASDIVRIRTEAYFQDLIRGRRPSWPVDAYVPPNSSLPLSVFRASGGFDDRFGRFREEIDLGLRLWGMGVEFRFLPSAVGRQIYVKSSEDLVRNEGRWWAKSEILLTRKHPKYRPYTSLGIASQPILKRILREWIIRLPLSLEPPLRLPCWIFEKLRAIPGIRRMGARLLRTRINIASARGAVREAGSWEGFRGEFAMHLPVLMYHHVGPRRRGTYPELTVSPEQFEREVKWLATHGYRGIRMADWIAWIREGKPFERAPVLFTFDDAYSDIAEHALPVLQAYGVTALIFVVTGCLGGTNQWDEARGSGTHRLMTVEQIREWTAKGFEFGAHSQTHADLRVLSRDEMKREIVGSSEALASIVGKRVNSFAYPYGFHNEAVRDVVRSTFDLAFTAESGLNDLRSDFYLLRRASVYPGDSLIDLACRVRFGTKLLQRHRSRIVRAAFRLRWRGLSSSRFL